MPIRLETILPNAATQGSATATMMAYDPLHWWTLNRSDARDAAGVTLIDPRSPRLASVPLRSFDDEVVWQQDGAWEVPYVTTGLGYGKFTASIPNPGAVFSVLETGMVENANAFSWGMIYAGLAIDSGLRAPQGGAKIEINNIGSPISFGTGLAPNGRGCKATVVNLSAKSVSSAVNGGDFATIDTTTNSGQMSVLAVQPDASITLEFGRAGSGDPHYGRINDLLIVAGDIRNTPSLWADYDDYCRTGWA